MKINFSQIRNKVRNASFYIPFTVYFIAFSIAAFVLLKIPLNNEKAAESSYSDIFKLLLTVAVAFCAVIISVAFLSVLIAYLYFIFRRRKNGITFSLSTDVKDTELDQRQTVKLSITPVLKPIFGFIKLRLRYDTSRFSQKFSLLENSNKKFFSTSIEGVYHWPLPEIKEYHVQKGLLYFEDIFQFFSIAVTLPVSSHFFTQPVSKEIKDLRVGPRKTEDTTTRIDQLRRVEGEYLNYKHFENNDDVRRIVWKIYAKNKELVVRVPETMDPYASQVYVYTSFFSHFNIEGNPAIETPFLNYFKVIVWSVYQNLMKQGFEVRYITDQDNPKNQLANEQQSVKYTISTSNWHHANDLKSFVKISDASVVIISSLCNANELKELMSTHGKDVTFIIVKLTDSFKNQHMIDWVQWLFVSSEKENIDSFKRGWAMSSMRQKIKDNEKRLEKIVSKYQEAVEL